MQLLMKVLFDLVADLFLFSLNIQKNKIKNAAAYKHDILSNRFNLFLFNPNIQKT